MTPVIHLPGADVKANSRFVCVQTCSGYRGPSVVDYRGRQFFFEFDVDDVQLGDAVVAAVAASRWVSPRKLEGAPFELEVDSLLFDVKMNEARYESWVMHLVQRFSFKSKRALFKDMKSCGICLERGNLTFSPMHHEKLELWSQSKELATQNVLISRDCASAAIGASLRAALARCN